MTNKKENRLIQIKRRELTELLARPLLISASDNVRNIGSAKFPQFSKVLLEGIANTALEESKNYRNVRKKDSHSSLNSCNYAGVKSVSAKWKINDWKKKKWRMKKKNKNKQTSK